MSAVAAITEIEGRSLDAIAAERQPVQCNYCREPVVHDGDIWRHVRTGLSADWRSKDCQPMCRDCGKPAVRAIGGSQFIGSGIAFVIDHFLCLEHLRGSAGIVDHIQSLVRLA